MLSESTPLTADNYSIVASEWNALLHAAVDAIIVIDHKGCVETFNSAAETIFGFEASEIMGKNVSLLMPAPFRSEHDNYIQSYLETGAAKIIGVGREVEGKRKSGEVFPIGLAVGKIPTLGQPKFVGIVRDISDRKRSDEELHRIRERLSQFGRLSTLGEMAAGLAHELNQPLTAIATYIHASQRLIESGRSDDKEILTTLEKCDAQVRRAGDVIRRLRQFVQKRESGRQEVSCENLISDVEALVEVDTRTNNIQLTIDIADGLPLLVVDTVQIQQVILNLIRNGIDAMSANRGDNNSIVVAVTMFDDERIKIAVTDHGGGISDAAREKIFEPFFTTKSSGLGLGLVICQSIARSHGGVLAFTNNQSEGTTFYFTLPTNSEPEK